ncbi:SipW-dependent-type signal peptide-containing protein [Caloramator sp. CAR-1]|uniref:SipW-dependent-type signal peptide-containing protein n=1 Tax=Caloramator sp. CAR-1 TaxID=3062777 RepID=UPI0026E2DE02|nr:SipW-dependent-type signal peptide-containing protein [Caloramator sp. CAR-1]MDO6354987.1 SipW-dependent-type signal peptide-containing protein [Caloramator sp. CAR-1]
MKKSRFFALILAVAVMLMGAGYAYWTDSVTFSNTVKTGQVELAFDKNDSGSLVFQEGNQGVATGSAEVSADSATITVNNLYPGASTSKSLTIVNDSTIPVKLIGLSFIPSKEGIVDGELIVNAVVKVGETKVWEGSLVNGLNFTNQNVIVPAETDVTIDLSISMPTTATASESKTFSFTVSPQFLQFNQ